jgi:hypothetical protein
VKQASSDFWNFYGVFSGISRPQRAKKRFRNESFFGVMGSKFQKNTPENKKLRKPGTTSHDLGLMF